MPVLKQHNTTPAMREAIVLDLGDIGAQAARIRAAAETEASKIIADAQAKSVSIANQLQQEAQQQGHAEGLEKGLLEGREQGRAEALSESAEQLRQLMAAWSQVATEWEQQRADMEREARQAVLAFALSVAEKVVHRVIEVDESVVVDQAAQALSLVLSAHDASVRIHPVDRPILEDAIPQLINELDSLDHIELVDDEAITPGGCMVAFGQGRVDATIERQLQRLIDLMIPEPPPIEEALESPAQTQDEAGPIPLVDLQGAADAAAQELVEPVIEPVSKPPIYEITDDGLVQTHGEVFGDQVDSLDTQPDNADETEPPMQPEAEV
ncbi:MAG: FliH/SctL family protein [Planctomycetota bacterium]